MVGLDLVDNRAYKAIGATVLCVIGRRDETYASLSQQFLGCGSLLFVAGIEYRNRVSAEHIDYLHTRDVGLSVAEVYHIAEGNALLIVGGALVHHLRISRTEDALADFEEELRFGGVINCDSRPLCHPIFVVYESSCENMLEFLGNDGAFDDFRKS